MPEGPLKVVDISEPQEKAAAELLQAANEQGFLFVDGHDFTCEEVDKLFELSKRFFTETACEEKMKHKLQVEKNIGYTDFNAEQLDPKKAKDFKECFNFGRINVDSGEYNVSDDYYDKRSDKNDPNENPVPTIFKDNNELLVSTMQKLHKTANEILRLITIALEIDNEEFFTDKHSGTEKSGCALRMLRYPLTRSDVRAENEVDYDPNIRAGAHTDYGSMTLLFQREGQQGLEIQVDEEKDEFVKVPFLVSKYEGKAPPLVVNIADLMSFWTNGVLRSTVHRVNFNPGDTRTSDRYSIVFFVHPDNDTTLDLVPSEIVKNAGNGIDRPVITAWDHLKKRLTETYTANNIEIV